MLSLSLSSRETLFDRFFLFLLPGATPNALKVPETAAAVSEVEAAAVIAEVSATAVEVVEIEVVSVPAAQCVEAVVAVEAGAETVIGPTKPQEKPLFLNISTRKQSSYRF